MFRITQLQYWNKCSCDCPGGCGWTIACLSAYKGYQNLVYRCLQSFTTKITQDSRPQIIVALLMLIVKMGQGECSIRFWLWRWPIWWFYLITTNSHLNNLTQSTKHCWRSIDTLFATGISALRNRLLWHRISITVFWQSFYPLHVRFHLSLHCSLIVHINISFKIYFKVSANCR